LDSHLQPCSKVDGFVAVRVLAQALDEQRRYFVDVGLAFQHVAERINRIHYPSVLAMHLLIRLCKGIELLADCASTPDGIEVGLGEGLLILIYLWYRRHFCGGDLIGRNANNWPISLVKTALDCVHVASVDAIHVPYSGEGSPEWAWDRCKRVKSTCVHSPQNPVQHD
jgi:hypothetical protein